MLVRHEAVHADAFVSFLTSQGIPPDYAQVLAHLDTLIASGAQAEVTGTVARVTGRPPRSFADFVRSR